MPLPILTIIRRLAKLYGRPQWRPHHDPISELVLTVLSQNTADINSGRAFLSLRATFPSWEVAAAAPTADLVDAIQVGGLAQQKAPRIQAILRAIQKRAGGWHLDFLETMTLEEARAWLRSLPGVGPKTAACVLLFALGRPALPVDTHVERVAKRLGLVPPQATAEAAHQLLESRVAPADYYVFHRLLIKHGRRTCMALRPACERCPLERGCPASRLRPDRDPTLP